jgi:hypothetical protein
MSTLVITLRYEIQGDFCSSNNIYKNWDAGRTKALTEPFLKKKGITLTKRDQSAANQRRLRPFNWFWNGPGPGDFH